jgi:hypothetical protein
MKRSHFAVLGVKNRLLRLFWRCETMLALGLAWVLVFVMPFRHTAALIGGTRQIEPSKTASDPTQTLKRAASVTRRLERIAPLMPFRTTCLVRAIAGWLLLSRRGLGSTIRFGVAMEDSKLSAHAWLIVEGVTLLGGAEAEGFQPLADLGG